MASGAMCLAESVRGCPWAVFTRNIGILPILAWPTSVGWCLPGPPGLALWARTSGDGARAAPNRERRDNRATLPYDALTGIAVHCVPARTTRW